MDEMTEIEFRISVCKYLKEIRDILKEALELEKK